MQTDASWKLRYYHENKVDYLSQGRHNIGFGANKNSETVSEKPVSKSLLKIACNLIGG